MPPPLLNLPPPCYLHFENKGGEVDAGAPQAKFFGNFSWKTIGKRLFFTVKSLRMYFKIVKMFASGGKNTRKIAFEKVCFQNFRLRRCCKMKHTFYKVVLGASIIYTSEVFRGPTGLVSPVKRLDHAPNRFRLFTRSSGALCRS